ncbi:MAG: SpoIIIAH-like family protein [Desulfotomaculales bacterium]
MRCILLRRKRIWLGLVSLAVLVLIGSLIRAHGMPVEGTVAKDKEATGAQPAPEPQANLPLPRESTGSKNFFVEYRIERERARGKRVELLREIIADPNAGTGTRQAAQDQLLSIAREIDAEVRLENLLRAKGFEEAAVFVEDEKITVVVPDEISPEQNTSIINLITRGVDVLPENVMIITRVE